MILCLTIYSSLSRPRTEQVRLRQALHRDGALFFLVSSKRQRQIILHPSYSSTTRITIACRLLDPFWPGAPELLLLCRV